ncbi:hypothetical protein ACGFOU_26440 [Streptomyces sp. NPDC048595]|uniref:hypothetical protein n=1 Tax=Streptomyces sp. NPDC048595 TaxID=3365576 RepID=UPI003721A93C
MKIDRIERDVDRPAPAAALEMPRQAPPVDRNGTTTAGTYGDAAGVEADGFFDTLTKILQI